MPSDVKKFWEAILQTNDVRLYIAAESNDVKKRWSYSGNGAQFRNSHPAPTNPISLKSSLRCIMMFASLPYWGRWAAKTRFWSSSMTSQVSLWVRPHSSEASRHSGSADNASASHPIRAAIAT